MSFDLATRPIVKVCGLQSLEAAEQALKSGATLLGIICVPNRKRTVSPNVARDISNLVHNTSTNKNAAQLVGVFRNQSKEEVLKIAEDYKINIVQLHGDESWQDYQDFLQMPIIKRMIFPRDCDEVHRLSNKTPCKVLPLFDSEAGGAGELLNWESISKWSESSGIGSKFILAGGLTADNVKTAMSLTGVIGVDVSGGVETNGTKDFQKISDFVNNAYACIK